ncbi:MAG: hypothetical protein DWQ02_08175, partial [Bacteroidetes bacterium]
IDSYTKHEMVNTGTGQNIGLDLMVEKAFSQATFILLSGSIFDSKYTDASGREFSSIFDSGYAATAMGGKEWTTDKGNIWALSLRGIYNGGQRLTPLLPGVQVSRYSQNPALDEAAAFTEQVQDYMRADLRFSFRKNNPKSAWSIALDVQNVTNNKNIDPLNRNYDPDLNAWVYREQASLTPILSWQIDF